MTTRTDVAYDIARSPRIATVAKASDEMIMQDYVDTTRPFESSFEAMSQPFLMSASGKEDLGGGVFVAITITEEDMKLAFEPELIAVYTGTVTTGSGAPDLNGELLLTDSNAQFETDGIVRGTFLINYTDQSIADVVEVLSETTMITTTLMNGSDDEWDIGDDYHVHLIVQKTTVGGNLVAVDNLDATFPAILPTAFTQVVQQSSSSGTIQNLSDIEADLTTIVAQTTAEFQADAVWDALISAHEVTGSFGEFVVRRLLTTAKFFALRI